MLCLLRKTKFLICLVFLFSLSRVNVLAVEPHPLRPFPYELTEEEADRSHNDPILTPYCASRPTAVQIQNYDKRQPKVEVKIIGVLTSDLTKFITPLLSITDTGKPDYDLSYEKKIQRYLLDYLEGRAYYEPEAEVTNPDYQEAQDILNRSGIFRELAAKSHQDKLKQILIQRANNHSHQYFSDLKQLEDVYGFTPATLTVHQETVVGYWRNNQVVDYHAFGARKITLKDFKDHWPPLPEEFTSNRQAYISAYRDWAGISDAEPEGNMWYQLWPYVPMFSREDSLGYIVSVPEPGQQGDEEIAKYAIHPHLARTYEVAGALHSLLTPKGVKPPLPIEDPELPSEWVDPPWDSDIWWLDSSHAVWMAGIGPVCEPLQTVIFSSGDLAQEDIINSNVDSFNLPPEIYIIDNPDYDPSQVRDSCGWHYTCEKCRFNPLKGLYYTDDSDCKLKKDARFSAVYLQTYTPFLGSIMDLLVTSPTAPFNFFFVKNQTHQNWPGVGNQDEETLKYSFSGGRAESGLKKSPDLGKFFYKYLGYIHCQKERLLAFLTPSGQYQYFDEQCDPDPDQLVGYCDGVLFSELSPPPSTTSKANTYFQSFILPKLTEELVSVYAQAEKETGVPCEVLAGIHFIEGSNNPNQSLVSGRPLGTPEPDAGGRVFTSLLETAVYAGDLLKNKVGGSIDNLETLTTALSRYNGGGNSNCSNSYSCSYAATQSCSVGNCCDLKCREECARRHNKTIYDFVYPLPSMPFCPRQFEGDDDPYPVNWYDQRHQEMYLLYCADRTMCTPQIFMRPGALTVAVEYYLSQP